MEDVARATSVVELFETRDWESSFSPDKQMRAVTALERGRVLFFPHLAFDPDPEARRLLGMAAGDEGRKNVSLDPATGRVHGTSAQDLDKARLGAVMEQFGGRAHALVGALFPRYASRIERARTSFRPSEIAGRASTARHDDKLLHVDAFPTRPTGGRRILRVFANAAPDGVERVWRVGEPFEAFARRFMPKLRRPLPGQAYVMHKLGLTKTRRSAYDHYMLRLHDAAKLDAGYQRDAPRTVVSFPPGTAWMCYTDCVLHAALAGRFAFEQTFHLPVEAMADPTLSPLRVLERITGRKLGEGASG